MRARGRVSAGGSSRRPAGSSWAHVIEAHERRLYRRRHLRTRVGEPSTASPWLQPLRQPLGILHGEALVIVVEIRVDVATLVEPGPQPVGHPPQPTAAVAPRVLALQRVGAMETDVTPIRGALPRVIGQQ